jgi:hypothetical protein
VNVGAIEQTLPSAAQVANARGMTLASQGKHAAAGREATTSGLRGCPSARSSICAPRTTQARESPTLAPVIATGSPFIAPEADPAPEDGACSAWGPRTGFGATVVP